MRIDRRGLLAAPALMAQRAAGAREPARRILFMGDSITYAGGYIHDLDAWLRVLQPHEARRLIGLGLPSEGVTGLTERDHPFPRPNAHERLGRALRMIRPDHLFACYGMNDGIYAPFDEERFRLYREGIGRLVKASRAAGARVTLLTPPPFDPQPVAAATRGEGAPEYGWRTPFRGYDSVLQRYGLWLTEEKWPAGVAVVDTGARLRAYLKRVRAARPATLLAPDGVHQNDAGHALMALAILPIWGADPAPDLRFAAAPYESGWRLTATARPAPPMEQAWDLDPQAEEEFIRLLGGRRMLWPDAPAAELEIREAARSLGRIPGHALRGGVLTRRLPGFTLHGREQELLKRVKQLHRTVDPAWLSHVGHLRPDVPRGEPIEAAQAKEPDLLRSAEEAALPAALRLSALPVDTRC